MRFEPVAIGCISLIVGLPILLFRFASVSTSVVIVLSLALSYNRLQRNRWVAIRCHSWAWVRYIYQVLAIYNFEWRLNRAYSKLKLVKEELDLYPSGTQLLDKIIASGPPTFQSKPTNRVQIDSLMECICCNLVPKVYETGANPLVMDIGAGKALLTRAVYEALDRKVPVVALDSRHEHDKDRFYDPAFLDNSSNADASYDRVVADVRYLAAKTLTPIRTSKGGGVIAVTKHLCGGATDSSLMALCKAPLDEFVGACCLAPCCHQKTKRHQYCNVPFLESMGFCETHIGMRGGVQDVDFGLFGKLISISRVTDLRDFEYSKSRLLKLLGFRRSCRLGRKARRLLEEGRIRYLQDHGFEDAHLVRYCDESVTGDNLAIIATRNRNKIPAVQQNATTISNNTHNSSTKQE